MSNAASFGWMTHTCSHLGVALDRPNHKVDTSRTSRPERMSDSHGSTSKPARGGRGMPASRF